MRDPWEKVGRKKGTYWNGDPWDLMAMGFYSREEPVTLGFCGKVK
jgi:hypothetical protein